MEKTISSTGHSAAHKGIEPLLATVLILMIAVVIATVLMNWSSLIVKDHTRTISNKTSTAVKCGDIYIEDVYLDFTKNISRIIVRSIDSSDTITSASVVTSGGVSLGNLTELPVSIASGQLKTIEFNMKGNLSSCSDFGEAIVATKCISDKYAQIPKNC